MWLKRWGTAVLLAAVAPFSQAASPDPFYGEDAHAQAVLDCHADYARRWSGAMTAQRATATEVATAAQAACAGQMEAFLKSRFTAVGTDEQAKAMMAPGPFVEHHRQRMRDYAFAYTLDAYLKASTPF